MTIIVSRQKLCAFGTTSLEYRESSQLVSVAPDSFMINLCDCVALLLIPRCQNQLHGAMDFKIYVVLKEYLRMFLQIIG